MLFVVSHGGKVRLAEARPFRLFGFFSGWLTIAFIREASKCLSGTT